MKTINFRPFQKSQVCHSRVSGNPDISSGMDARFRGHDTSKDWFCKGLNFTKMVASGNDFVVIDNRLTADSGERTADSKLSKMARHICDRRYGVGGDGLIIIEPSKKADFRMRVINPDGSEAEMCGNGARCAALFAKEKKIAGKKMRFDTLAGIIEAEVYPVRDDLRLKSAVFSNGVGGGVVKLKMPDPQDLRRDIRLVIGNGDYSAYFVNTGVPHTVVYVEDLDSLDVKRLGSRIRYHKRFAPRGTNVDFVETGKGNLIRVRTYERGVEDETLACGTGVTASAVVSAAVKNFKSPVVCLTEGGDKLKIYFKRSGDDFTDVYLEGGAREVFSGAYFYNRR